MPETHPRCKYRFNNLLNWKVGQMKKTAVVFKVLHADPEFCKYFDSSLDTDLVPCIVYSLNKQKRWEVSIDQDLLELLQFMNENLEIKFFERVSIGAWIDTWHMFTPNYHCPLQCSKIRKICEISKEGDYREEKFGGVGRFYGPSTPKTKKVHWTPTKMEIVTYSIVKEPRNWKKVYTKDFKKYFWDRHNDTYLRKSHFDPKSVKWDLEEFYDYNYELEAEIIDKPIENETSNLPKFYDLYDCLVEKKPRKCKKFPDVDGFLWV